MGLIVLPRLVKRAVLIANDFLLLALALWLSLALRLSTLFVPPDRRFALLMLAAPLIGIATFAAFGLYRLVTRFISARGTVRIFIAVGLAVLIWALLLLMTGAVFMPRSVVIMYGFLASALIWASRQLAGWVLKGLPHVVPATFDEDRRRQIAVIYGAGGTGVQLLQTLRRSPLYGPIGFVDDDRSLWGQYVNGLKVYAPHKLPKLIDRNGVEVVLLAMPESRRRERRDVIRRLEPLAVQVKTLPALEDLASGRVKVTDLRPVDARDLLGRDAVPPDPALLSRNIRDKAVLVTGAGGSIGSELARQVVRQLPRQLVLLEQSELALYGIEMEINELAGKLASRPRIAAVLGSVLDPALVRETLARHEIETIYHAAAYKHVPIVEHNPIVGLKNNTYGTEVLARAARLAGVERLVLISTDKAVRPTNIMGASKRLAELVLQALAAEEPGGTVFTMVRFGNVLDSSGSVVHRFRKQIEAGGPVTVTHPEIIRYFMSIPEAAELVLQAGAMASGGDVFVLDMGEPVKIDDLARSMIRLMGLDVQDAANPDGDIAISYVGLRPGEKLYEELLIGETTSRTEHARIMRNREPYLPHDELTRELDSLKSAMALGDIEAIQAVLMRTVEGYRPRIGEPTAAVGDARNWAASSRLLN